MRQGEPSCSGPKTLGGVQPGNLPVQLLPSTSTYFPVVRTYEFILPDYVEDRISSFVGNIGELNLL